MRSRGIAYQRCLACGAVWYFRRPFCPRCGTRGSQLGESAGRGTVYAATLVHRPPSKELRALAPYLIILVDVDEGFRLMGHGERSLVIGDHVRARSIDFAGTPIAYFESAGE